MSLPENTNEGFVTEAGSSDLTDHSAGGTERRGGRVEGDMAVFWKMRG